MEMTSLIYKDITELIPYGKNPRDNKKAVKAVEASIQEFGFKVPIVIDKNNVIVCGHTRYKAAQNLRLKSVPCIIADDLTDEQIKAYRLADNKTAELSSWDSNLLTLELSDIINIDMTNFGFKLAEFTTEEDKTYTKAVNIPQYEITGEKPDISSLVDNSKTKELISEIRNANIGQEEKEFLKKAAQRHLKFDYRKVAEYYAHSTPEMQNLMEKSALVIIDYNDAIANGYAKLKNVIEEMRAEDYER